MSGYAVRKDLSGWRLVDGPTADTSNPDAVYPDREIEFYSETKPESLVTPVEQIVAAAISKRDSLLSIAAIRIAPLQDAIDLDIATADDAANLSAWKKYRVQLNRVDQQAGYPAEIEWPKEPG